MATTRDGKEIIPGAEPWSAPGGPHGALVVHGFTGNPQSMRGLAEALHGAGYAVELPLLPGHGTSVDDMIGTGWADWSAAAANWVISSRGVDGSISRIAWSTAGP